VLRGTPVGDRVGSNRQRAGGCLGDVHDAVAAVWRGLPQMK
jgi:hypothetical protein